MTAPSLSQDSRATVSVVFAASIIPLIMLLSLSIDIGRAIRARAILQMAADNAAVQGATTASQAYMTLTNPATTPSQAASAGTQSLDNWFTALSPRAQANSSNLTSGSGVASSGTTFTATANFTAAVPTFLATIFGSQYSTIPVAGTSVVVLQAANYVELDLLIDDSSSMLIADNATGLSNLSTATACSMTGDVDIRNNADGSQNYPGSGEGGGPITSASTGPIMTTTNGLPTVTGGCSNLITTQTYGRYTYYYVAGNQVYPNPDGTYSYYSYVPPNTGDYGNSWSSSRYSNLAFTSVACGFGCHWDSRSPSAGGKDFYYIATNQISNGTGSAIQLRYNDVQTASQQVISTMISQEQNSGISNQFSMGIYTFDTKLNQVYPSAGNGGTGTNLSAANTALGNITPPITNFSPDTNFPGAVATLTNGSYLTAAQSGAGSSPSNPRKNLFLITDGLEDYCTSGAVQYDGTQCGGTASLAYNVGDSYGSGGNPEYSPNEGPGTAYSNAAGWTTETPSTLTGTRIQQPILSDHCNSIKNLGINVWVLYTTYTPITNDLRFNGWIAPFTNTNPTDNNTYIYDDLAGCASAKSQIFVATDSNSIATALQNMLLAAENSPAIYTQ